MMRFLVTKNRGNPLSCFAPRRARREAWIDEGKGGRSRAAIFSSQLSLQLPSLRITTRMSCQKVKLPSLQAGAQPLHRTHVAVCKSLCKSDRVAGGEQEGADNRASLLAPTSGKEAWPFLTRAEASREDEVGLRTPA